MEKLTLEQLKKLSTGRLLAYKRSINYLAYAAPEDGFFDCTCSWCEDARATRKEWESVFNNIKKVLSTREHVERKKPQHILTDKKRLEHFWAKMDKK